MKVKTKKVYYCEYCNKHSLKPLLQHEKYCTSNINRECRVCKEHRNYESIINEFKKRYEFVEEEIKMLGKIFRKIDQFKWLGEPITIQEIKDSVDDCPACTLTIIKHIDAKYMNLDFDYKDEMEKRWKEQESLLEYHW